MLFDLHLASYRNTYMRAVINFWLLPYSLLPVITTGGRVHNHPIYEFLELVRLQYLLV
ncbi:hypothetical protein RchiOBHm_Chr2g0134841 [Rosa chinensis]|uniref:Uncharacterized protein n=1 Tax=Rosa chinensis TaxID=74649 RepID=A0A2P6RVX2_ROSCH|nr:hypothetical protein RchiOBHm_Chr2g0134841 [Rosa chinensis]